jgi:hypothetical protein
MQLPSDMMGFTCSCSPANCLLMRSSSISLLLGPELASCICCLIATLSASLVFLLSFFKRMITIISTSVHRQNLRYFGFLHGKYSTYLLLLRLILLCLCHLLIHV